MDKSFDNQLFKVRFLDLFIRVLPRIKSNHHPILVEFNDNNQLAPITTRTFRFEIDWTQHEGFVNLVKNTQREEGDLINRLNSMTMNLKEWNRSIFGNIFQRKERVLTRLAGVQKRLNGGGNHFLMRLEAELTNEYNLILE